MTTYPSDRQDPADIHVLAMQQIGRNPRTEIERTIVVANYLIAHLVSSELGAYLAVYKEDDPGLSIAATAMHRIGAGAVVPPMLRASAAHDAYCEAEEADSEAKDYVQAEQHCARTREEAEREIRALGLDLLEILRELIRREYPLESARA